MTDTPGAANDLLSTTATVLPPDNTPAPVHAIVSGIKALRENWSGDPAFLEAKLKEAGLTDIRPDAAHVAIKDAVQSTEALAPPPDPSGYNLVLDRAQAASVEPDAAIALVNELREEFHAADVPAVIAQPVFDALMQSADQFPENKDGRDDYNNNQKSMLAKCGDVEELILLASIPLGRMSPDTVKMLHEGGSLQSASAILQLAAAGRMILHREGAKK